MTQFAGYQPAVAYPALPPHVPAFDESDVEVIQQSRFPSVLGFFTALYLVSVVTMSTASEATSWIPQVVGATLGVMWVVIGVFVKAQPLAWSKPITLFVLFTLWAGTGTLVTLSGDYFWILYSTSLKVTVVTWIALQCVRTRQDFLLCCFVLGLASLVVLYQGLDTILRSVQFTGTVEKKGARASGTLISNANDLGEFGVLVIMTATIGILGLKSKLLRLFAVVPLIVGLYIVAASGSRMSIVAVIVFTVGLYWFHFRKAGAGNIGRRIVITILAIGLFGGTVYYVKSLPFFFRLLRVVSSPGAAQEEPRFRYFKDAVGAVIEHPIFGLGMGGFTLAGFGRTATGEAHFSHSTVSETLSCQGLPGFLLYFGSRLALLTLLLRTRKLNIGTKDMAIVNIITAYFLVILVVDVLAMTFQHRLLWPFLGATCGYLWNLNRLHAIHPAHETA